MDANNVSEEAKTITSILRHRGLVAYYLKRLANALEERAASHDLSKFSEDEFEGFVGINQVAREYEYGSDEYKESIESFGHVALHYRRNRHHPEHFANSTKDMSLIDMIEMVVDWKAASEVYGQATLEDSIEISAERFKLSEAELFLVRLVVYAIEA